MEILFVGQNNKGWMYETLYYEQKALENEIIQSSGKVHYFGPGHKFCNNLDFKYFCKKKKIKIKNINLIIFYISHYTFSTGLMDQQSLEFFKCPNKNILNQLNIIDKIPRVLWLNDFWQMNKYERIFYEKKYKITHLLSTYFYHLDKSILNKYFITSKYPKDRIFHISRSIKNENVINKINQNRKIDVALLGAVNNFYPKRKKFLNLLKNVKNIKFFNKPHPGYHFRKKIDKNQIFGKKYFKILRNTKIFITCGTKFNLPIIKLYEILGSGCLLMCSKIYNKKKIGLKNGKNYIEVNEKNLIRKINFFLQNKKKLNQISKNGVEMIKKKFTNEIQAKKQFQIIKFIYQNHTEKKLLNNFELIILCVYLFGLRFSKLIKKLFF